MTKVSQILERAFDIMSQSLYTLYEVYCAAGSQNYFGPLIEKSKERENIERFIRQATLNFTDGENYLGDYFASKYFIRYLIREFEGELEEDRAVNGDPGNNYERIQLIVDSLQEILDRTKELYYIAKEIYPRDKVAKAWIEYAGLHKLIPELERNIKNLQQSIEEITSLKSTL